MDTPQGEPPYREPHLGDYRINRTNQASYDARGTPAFPQPAPAPRTAASTPRPRTAAPTRTFAWLVRHRYLLASIVAVFVAILGAVQSAPDSDLLTFFIPSAHYILAGQPFHMYQVRAYGVAYPNANPPLAIFLMAPAVALADKLGLSSNYHYLIGIVTIEFFPICLLLAYEVDATLRRLAPELADPLRYLVFLLALFSPLLWQSMLVWNHVEQPLMLYFLLLGLRLLQSPRLSRNQPGSRLSAAQRGPGLAQAQRDLLAGVCFGLALYSRSTALLALFPIFAALVWQRDWRGVIRAGVATAAVVIIGLAPFLLIDPSNTIISLETFHGHLAIGGNSIWTLFVGTPLEQIAQHLDTLAFTGLAFILAFLAAQRLGIRARDRSIYGAVALCLLTFPFLNKTVWSYYYLEPFVFLLIWEFATFTAYSGQRSQFWSQLGRAPIITLVYLSITMTLSSYISLHSVDPFFRRLTGVVEFGLMLSFMLAIWYRAREATPPITHPMGLPTQAKAP